MQFKPKGRKHRLWRAVDRDGLVLDIVVQERRKREAAERFLRRVLHGRGRRSTGSAGAAGHREDAVCGLAGGGVRYGRMELARRPPETPDRGPPPGAPAPPLLHWTRVLGAGLLLWLVSVALLVTTGAITLVPTVILLGSFLVPVTAVTFFFEHDPGPTLHLRTVVEAFLIGGLLGVFGAVALEAVLVGPGPLEYLGVGLIEEGAKLVALALIARRLPRYTTRDGVVLGAAVGFGFGALESSGYAFAALLTQNGLSVADLLQTEVLRGLLAPLGHGLWTGIAGGVLFRGASAAGRLRLTWALVGAYLAVAALHGLWDAMGDLAALLTYLFTATPAQRVAVEGGRLARLRPTEGQTVLYLFLYGGGLLVVSVVGLLWLRRLWTWGPPAPAPIAS